MTRSKASSTTGRKKTSKNSSTNASVKTQVNLEKNLKKIATTTPKAKAKSTSKKTTSRKKVAEIVAKNSRKKELFPHKSFPYRLEIKKEKRICWFECHDHAIKEINRTKLQSKDYTYQVYPKYLND